MSPNDTVATQLRRALDTYQAVSTAYERLQSGIDPDFAAQRSASTAVALNRAREALIHNLDLAVQVPSAAPSDLMQQAQQALQAPLRCGELVTPVSPLRPPPPPHFIEPVLTESSQTP